MKNPVATVDGAAGIDALFERLHGDNVAMSEAIEQLAARAAEIRPEQLIRHSLELDAVIGMTLINLLPETRLPADFSELDFDPRKIDNPILQISLLRYVAQTDAAGSADLLARFLEVPNKVVQMEALKALGNLQADFDTAKMTQHIENLPPAERSIAIGVSDGHGGTMIGNFDTGLMGSIEETRVDQGLVDIVLDDEFQGTNLGTHLGTHMGTHMGTRAQLSLPPSLEAIQSGRLWLRRYLIKREIGRGAMGKAVLAVDNVVDEQVVLKFMRPDLVLDDASVERFRREVKYARRIGHRNVIRVHDLLIHDQLCAISMEYFESRGLDRILRRSGTIAVRNCLKILYQVANGMAAAHEQSVVHRDLKPSNILIGKSGLLKVVDFGIASADRSADSTLTGAGSIVGSPAYLAPERVTAQIADERSDIYSLGIVGYYLFAGRLPYEGDLHEILGAHQAGDALPLAVVRPEVSAEISELIASMMAVDPDGRPASMLRVRNRISDLL